MGFLRKITGGVDKQLLATGLLGQGLITNVQLTGTTLQSGNGLVQRSCIFTVQVSLDGKDPYEATCKQRVPEIQLPQFQPGSTVIAVRVNPDDPTDIALDLQTAPPEVTTPAGTGDHSAAEILATGEPAQAVIVESMALNKRNPAGVEIYAYTLTVMPTGKDPYQIQVGNPTPPSALPFLFAGSHVPVKIGSIPNAVVIDWDKAVADSTAKA
ncbi:MAG TPA: hypothetical protein VG298_18210 [Acidimicrobiales bacterium]|jgi:hypothetical protein|nr:hypothetical protein [Acidimicrobiales bacterium]